MGSNNEIATIPTRAGLCGVIPLSYEKLEVGFLTTIQTQTVWLVDEDDYDAPRLWSYFKASVKGSEMDFEEWHKLNNVDEEMKLEQWGVKRLRLVMNDRNKMSRFEADLSIGVQDRRRQGSVELKVEMIRVFIKRW